MEKISVLITDDHALLREALTLTLSRDPRFQVVGEAGSGPEALELARRLRPRVVLMDIKLPGQNGMETTGQLRKLVPDTRVLMLSLHTQTAIARQALQKGAMGYVTKSSPAKEFFTAIQTVLGGAQYICQEIKNTITEQVLNGTDPGTVGFNGCTPDGFNHIVNIGLDGWLAFQVYSLKNDSCIGFCWFQGDFYRLTRMDSYATDTDPRCQGMLEIRAIIVQLHLAKVVNMTKV